MKHLLTAALVLAAFPAAAQLAPISPHLALANRGQCVSVEGTASVRSDPQRLGLDVDLDGTDSPAFGYILPGNEAQFPDLGSLAGQRVVLTGVVQYYLGRAEITLASAKQLSPAGGDEGGLTHIGPEYSKAGNQFCG
jgi:hypothetical protein